MDALGGADSSSLSLSSCDSPYYQRQRSRSYASPKLSQKPHRKSLKKKLSSKEVEQSSPVLYRNCLEVPNDHNTSAMISPRRPINSESSESFWNSPMEPGAEVNWLTELESTEYRDHLAEEMHLINKLKEDSLEPNFRNEIWVGGEDLPNVISPPSWTTKTHISNVLITHGNDEIVEGFVEDKPISSCHSLQPQRLRQSALPLTPRPESPDEYSYAYYEPGPARSVPKVTTSRVDRHARHTYTTRYGTEENIYEEISEVGTKIRGAGKGKSKRNELGTSQSSLRQTLVEEQVRQVQSNHRRVLGQLNLTMEAMLMPNNGGGDGNSGIGGVRELDPTPVTDLDSGFSGSSGNSSGYVTTYGGYVTPRARPSADNVDYRAAGYCRDNCCSSPQYRAPSSPIGQGNVYKMGHGARYAGGRVREQLGRGDSMNMKGSGAGTGSGGRVSWARKGWRRLAGLPPASNKVNAIHVANDEPHSKSGWDLNSYVPPGPGRPSSEDSCCSASDNELSSGDETSDKSVSSSIRSNGHLRQTLHKARSLCDKLQPPGTPGLLSRWFSMRRPGSNHYDIDGTLNNQSPGKMPLLPEIDEEGGAMNATFTRRTAPPTLPPQPPNLTMPQIKRRQIVSAIVHNENSYVSTLQRLVNEYKKPLEESSPAILSSQKISILFRKLPEILQCHTLFRIALAEAVRTWDQNERIGDVFIASFSKTVVIDVYSEFINNFSQAMDLAKCEAKRKNALYEFLQVKQMTSPDRLNFFGLMVKPVQRFPQLILLLQDLLKHTPHGHVDRMSLQLALTQLESLAEMLNERKREAEQFQAFKDMLRRVSGKLAGRPSVSGSRYLLREDNVTQLEFNAAGAVSKSKSRRLLLLNDLLLCVTAAPKEDNSVSSTQSQERLSLKWTHPVSDIEVLDTSASPTLSRLLNPSLARSSSLRREGDNHGSGASPNDLCQQMAGLMHDFEVLSRITDLVGTLRGSYKQLNVDEMRILLHEVQDAIRQKDVAMSWMDSCCLQLTLKNKAGKEETVTFQTENPQVKKEWTCELRLAQLALDPNNSPAWEVPEQEQRPTTKMPLFVKSQCIYSGRHHTEVRCGCFYSSISEATEPRGRAYNVVWVSANDEDNSYISVLAQHPQQTSQLRPLLTFELAATRVSCMDYVPSRSGDTVWMGTECSRILVYSAAETSRGQLIKELNQGDAVLCIRNEEEQVFAALANGSVNVFASHEQQHLQTLQLGTHPVTCLLPINAALYAACDTKVYAICPYSSQTLKSFNVQHGSVGLMAHSGVGLWISLANSSTICLYHTETFKHLQDINIANNVLRVTSPPNGACANHDCANNNRTMVTVTSLLACKGLLWVGTNVGICLTIPLPRLEGVPIISGRVNISYHAHFGPITFLLPLQQSFGSSRGSRNSSVKQCSMSPGERASLALIRSPVALRRKNKECEASRRMSKTLPRSLALSSTSSSGSGECDVYGLYGDLMNCREDPDQSVGYEALRNSYPDLSAKVTTLDKRLPQKIVRPRSLDLSNWSLAPHSSTLYSSTSEESMMKKSNSVIVKGRNEMKRSESTGALPNDSTDAGLHPPNKTTRDPEAERRHQKRSLGQDRRTVMTLMGGRGYVNWHDTCTSRPEKEPNCTDAHLVIWETKL